MRLALKTAEDHQTPFGAVIAMGDQSFVTAANLTGIMNDPTAHAEIIAIRKMAEHLQKSDLSGYQIYTTCEPCPMCMGAIIWSGLEAVIYGCSIDETEVVTPGIRVSSQMIASRSFREVTLSGGFLKDECLELLEKFRT